MKGNKKKKKYIPRILDKVLKEHLKLYGAVLITGPKWCGKSTTAKQHSKSVLELQNPMSRDNNLEIANTRPDLLLEGKKPLLIDEWQDAPCLWDAVRYDVDNSGLLGQYILTGSVTPRESVPKHTGTGRIARLLMRPMSLYESGDSVGKVSLADLFDGIEDIECTCGKTLEDIAFLCARGGWPASVGFSRKGAVMVAHDYLNSLVMNDVLLVDGVERNPSRLRSVLRSLARNICTTANMSTIKNDIAYNEASVSEKTIAKYINVLNRLFVIEDVEAWCPRLRSRGDIRSTPKRCFVDPSLALAALRATDLDLLKDFKTFGFMFEALCLRDLRVYAQSLNGDVFFYRDKSGLECDAVVHLDDGRWGAIEIKLGADSAIDLAAKNLLKFAKKVDADEMNSASFLMVLTGGKYAYRRKDGVYVVPLAVLKD